MGIARLLFVVSVTFPCTEEGVEDLTNTELMKTGKKSVVTTKSGKQLEIALVEGSFRRIAGIKERCDTSGAVVVRTVEILREPGKSLGFYIQRGDGWERKDGVFVSRIHLGSIVQTNGLLNVGDEILKVNNVDVTQMPLETVVVIMKYVTRLFLTVRVLISPSLTRTYSLQKSPSHRSRDARPSAQSSMATQSLPRDFCYTSSSLNPYEEVDVPSQPRTSTPKVECKQQTTSTESTNLGTPPRTHSETRDYEPVILSPHGEQGATSGGWISTESLRTLGREEQSISEIDYGDIDQSLDARQYSGNLSITLVAIDSLIPTSDDTSLSCSIMIDSELTIHADIPVSPLPEKVTVEETFNIQLIQSRRIGFKFANGLLSSTKSIPLAHFIPTISNTLSYCQHALTLDPIGRLRFSLEFCPFPAAVPRWGHAEHTPQNTATLRELATSNPSGSTIPLVLERGIQAIEEHGLETPGIYQMAASEAEKTDALNVCRSQSLHPSSLYSLMSQITVHAFTGVVKDFFLNLPQPFFSPDFSSSLRDAMQLQSDPSQQNGMVSRFIECLPDEVNTTMTFLLHHIRVVCQQGHTNKTSVDKMAQVFAPLLFTPAHSQTDGYVEEIDTHTSVLKMLILMQT